MNNRIRWSSSLLYGVSCMLVLASPGLAHAAVGDDIHNAFLKGVRFVGMFASGAIVVSWMRVGYTYLFSEFPEKTIERAKSATIGSIIVMGSYGLGQLFAGLFTTKTI